MKVSKEELDARFASGGMSLAEYNRALGLPIEGDRVQPPPMVKRPPQTPPGGFGLSPGLILSTMPDHAVIPDDDEDKTCPSTTTST